METKKDPRSFGTHDGTFHADEVTACAFLLLFNLIDRDKIKRTRDRNVLDKCEFICDVGGVYDPSQKIFDHHQADYSGDFSSAGMILKHLKDSKIITNREYQLFDESLVRGVDAHDNGKDMKMPGVCTYSIIIANYNPIFYDPPLEEEEAAFYEALDFAYLYLKRLWERYKYVRSCRGEVARAMETDGDYLLFEKGIPWQDLFFEMGGESHPAKFVIIRSGDHWNLRGIPPSHSNRMSVRVPLPKEWAGLLEDDFQKQCPIDGAIFCHKGRFISVWKTKEAALEALKYTLKYNEGR